MRFRPTPVPAASAGAITQETSTSLDTSHPPASDRTCQEGARSLHERTERMPSLARNHWSRPDLARVMNTELDYAPYVTLIDRSQRAANRS